jgi:hypothetical protein
MIFFKVGVNVPGLAFAGKVGLGPFWTWVQVLSYVHVMQFFISSFVSSFRHERISTVGEIYTKMQMQDLFDDFNLINYNQQKTTMGVLVGHIHLDKKYIQHTLSKGTIYNSLLIILFDSDCVHIYVSNLI